MSENVNTTMNETQPSSCPSRKKRNDFCFLPDLHCFFHWEHRHRNNCLQDEHQEKPRNFFIVNMAISDLLYPIISIPPAVQRLYIDSWLIGGPLGQVSCKLAVFLTDLSLAVSVQSLVLIAVVRFGAVVFSLRSPFSSKMCPFFILATWSRRDSCKLLRALSLQTSRISWKTCLRAVLE